MQITSRTRPSHECSRHEPLPAALSPRSSSSPWQDTRSSDSTRDQTSTSMRRSPSTSVCRRAGGGRPLLGDSHRRWRRAWCLRLVQGQVRRLLAGHPSQARGTLWRLLHRGQPARLPGNAEDGQDRRRRTPGGPCRRLITRRATSLRGARPFSQRSDRSRPDDRPGLPGSSPDRDRPCRCQAGAHATAAFRG